MARIAEFAGATFGKDYRVTKITAVGTATCSLLMRERMFNRHVPWTLVLLAHAFSDLRDVTAALKYRSDGSATIKL